jgi:hypothetical protein
VRTRIKTKEIEDGGIKPIDLEPGNPGDIMQTNQAGDAVERVQPASGVVESDFGGGGPMPFIIDTTRGNKQLSIDSANHKFSHKEAQENDWFTINEINYAELGYPMQFNGTVIGMVVFVEEEDTAGNIDIWINGVFRGAGVTLGATGVNVEYHNMALDITFNESDILQTRMDNLASVKEGTIVIVYTRWRLGGTITTTSTTSTTTTSTTVTTTTT